MWRAVVSQPFDRACELPQLGLVDESAGEFWVENIFSMPRLGHNLSAYENNHLYVNLGGQDFVDVSFASRANLDSDSRSVIIADFNADQRQDLLVGSVGGGPLRLFLNRFPSMGHRIRVNLIGTDSNRQGIGSRVVVSCGNRKIVRDHFAPNGFMGQSPADLLIGIGDSTTIDQLSIRWPTGREQRFDNVPINATITVREGDGALEVESFEIPMDQRPMDQPQVVGARDPLRGAE